MTQENKKLLLKDLCGRLPYKVIVEIISYAKDTSRPWFGELSCKDLDCFIHDVAYESIRPYLRPMSTMTEKEKMELLKKVVGKNAIKYFKVLSSGSIDNTDNKHQSLDKFSMHWVTFNKSTTSSYIDWCNKHHFDYRGLIQKGLAIEAPENMYNI